MLKDLNKIGTGSDQITETQLQTMGGNLTVSVSGIEFLRPSIGRCSGHTFEYAGYINYSQGLPQYQQVNIPSESRLTKNRKNVGGGLFYYSGLDHEGLNWAGDTATNLATGESFNLAVSDAIVDVTIPATFDQITASSINIGGSGDVKLDNTGLTLSLGKSIKFGSTEFYT
ncbi:MAG: hypothetical protein O1I36_18190, partial [Cylindrospermopsis raciborskii PAMP2011]|nr:hypothetical protein [Cylindrospermopsis raciborskii PAMP2011]